MQTTTEAEEHLRVIRSLMERATIYRAIAAPTAMSGGIFSVCFGVQTLYLLRTLTDHLGNAVLTGKYSFRFCLGWFCVLGSTLAANTVFLWLAARMRKEPFFSRAMRKALGALFPPLLCGAVFTLCVMLGKGTNVWTLPSIWMIFYGLGLLGTAQFAPRSIVVLGWCFLLTGLLAFGAEQMHIGQLDSPYGANLLMMATFGFFHVVYAFVAWPRKSPFTADGPAWTDV